MGPIVPRRRANTRPAGDREPLAMPRNLAEAAESEGRSAWLATLPPTILMLAERWSLTVGAPFQPGGRTAWVAPVRDAEGRDLVLKVGWRHPEALHEAAGLRVWDGRGAVRLYDALDVDEDTTALLLEHCRPGTTLAVRPEEEQDPVVAGLLRRLWGVPVPDRLFRPLQAMCDRWADEFEAKTASGPATVDAGLAREGIELFRSLPRGADRHVLLVTDLHAGNVLAAEREPWLVVDPKPYAGDPAYDSLQHILNCGRRLHDDPRGLARRMADLLDLDPDRLLCWLFARCVQESADWPELAGVARRIAPR
jgi:streptomycin 6-kinase